MERRTMQAPDYFPLGEYALIGNRRSAALVARSGSIDWCCLPRFDSPALFCRILDARRGGSFRVSPSEPFKAERRYVSGASVLETVFTAAGGAARMTDVMLFQDGGSMIARCVEGLQGRLSFQVELNPTYDFARGSVTLEASGAEGVALGRTESLRVACPRPVQGGERGLRSSFDIGAGDRCWVWLGHATGRHPPRAPAAADLDQALAAQIAADRDWSRRCNYDGPYADLVRRSALVLRLLTHQPTGGIVAAPTTSLPECVGGERNWDYRYTWMRDAAWALDGLMSVGYHDEAMAFWRWLGQRGLGDGEPLSVLYTVAGEPPPPERLAEGLEGYRGSAPVRIGNGAVAQTQLDVFGEVVGAIHTCSELMLEMQPLSPGLWRLVEAFADAAAAQWRQPGHGMWEVRGEKRHYLSSKLMCWTALDRALLIAKRDGAPGRLGRWRAERSAIAEAILAEGYNPHATDAGAFVQSFGSTQLDASALLIPLVGFLPVADSRVRSTVRRIEERLTEGGLVRRYTGSDGLAGREGTFLLCSFWLVEYYAAAGDLDRAWELFGRIAACANDVGLFSEEFDPRTGELLGNFPQALTHLAMIRAATALSDRRPALPRR